MDFSYIQPIVDCGRAPFECVQRPFVSFLSMGERMHWLYLLSAVLVASMVYLRTKSDSARSLPSFLKWLFPRSIYLHRSTLTDLSFFWINRMLFPILFASYLTLAAPISGGVLEWLRPYTERFASQASSVSLSLFFTIYIVLAMDFGIYIAHYIMHRVPYLWEFHKVHHSAEVLSPFTVYRVHPVDDLISLSCGLLMTGFFGGVFQAFLPNAAHYITVDQVNIIFYIFYFCAYNLRHSHVWFSYGPVLSKVFISPAQHQIHHSDDPKHYDKNFGLIFAVWDWLASTLYIPVEKEEVRFGIGKESERYRTVRALYFRPFLQVGKMVRRRIRKAVAKRS